MAHMLIQGIGINIPVRNYYGRKWPMNTEALFGLRLLFIAKKSYVMYNLRLGLKEEGKDFRSSKGVVLV